MVSILPDTLREVEQYADEVLDIENTLRFSLRSFSCCTVTFS